MAVAQSCKTKATKAGKEKGYLQFRRKYASMFPPNRSVVTVLVDDGKPEKSYAPFTETTKECRISGMQKWYKRHGINPGDTVRIDRESPYTFVYRLSIVRRAVEATARRMALQPTMSLKRATTATRRSGRVPQC